MKATAWMFPNVSAPNRPQTILQEVTEETEGLTDSEGGEAGNLRSAEQAGFSSVPSAQSVVNGSKPAFWRAIRSSRGAKDGATDGSAVQQIEPATPRSILLASRML